MMEQGVVPDLTAEAAAAGLGYRLQIWLVAGVVAEVIAEIAAEIAAEVAAEVLVEAAGGLGYRL